MTVTIQGVPAAITRTAVNELVRTLCIDSNDLISVTIDLDGIKAVVRARDEHGKLFVAGANEIGTHTICIRLVEDEPLDCWYCATPDSACPVHREGDG